jgi:GNAT superfamily N-acetyltransferase
MAAAYAATVGDLVYGQGRKVSAGTVKAVLVALADHCNDEGEGAYPSIGTLESKTELSHGAVTAALDGLKRCGIIEASGLSKYRSVNYTIRLAELEKRRRPSATRTPPIRHADADHPPRGQNPLSNHQVNHPSGDDLEEIKAKANREVDGILEMERNAKRGEAWRSVIPEGYHTLAGAFIAASGVEPKKGKKGGGLVDWLATLDDWTRAGYTADMVARAVKACRSKGLTVHRPGSIDFWLVDAKGRTTATSPGIATQRTEEDETWLNLR